VLYDDRDRSRVRNALVAVTALAWLLSSWTLASETPRGTDAHRHGVTTDAGVVAAAAVVNWLVMLAAMMAPVLVQPIQFVRNHGLARRRGRSTLAFLAGYAAIWTVAGAVILSIAAAANAAGFGWLIRATGVLAIALVWQCSPAKQVCLNQCHVRPELGALGPRAETDVLMFGATHGVWCVGSCWAWMFVPLFFPSGHITAMTATTLLIFCERLDRPVPPGWRWRGLGTASRIVVGRLRMHQRATA
jgi:predicted metal-binding membrane protein